MTVKRAIAAWLSCGAGFAVALAGAPWPMLWAFLGTLSMAYLLAPPRSTARKSTMPDITSARVMETRERVGCGTPEAKLMLLQEDLQMAIARAQTVEELRACLAGLLTLVRRRF